MLPPTETPHLIGHTAQRNRFLEAYHSGHFPHGWILSGTKGVGKATFAYHMARYILSKRQDGETHIDPQDPLFRRIAAKSHGDLLLIEREEDKPEITVEQARKVPHFLSQTPAEGGWRIIIIDGGEYMNRSTMNAILKSLEEPPEKTVFFIISHSAGRLLATLCSRCQYLKFSPLEPDEMRDVVKTFSVKIPTTQFNVLLDYVNGSPGKLLDFYEEASLSQKLAELLESLPLISIEPALPIIKQGAEDEKAFEVIEQMLLQNLHRGVEKNVNGEKSVFPLEQSLLLWEKISGLFEDCRIAKLDRKATLFSVFTSLEKENL